MAPKRTRAATKQTPVAKCPRVQGRTQVGMKDVLEALCSRLTNLEQHLGATPVTSEDVIVMPTQELGPPHGDVGSGSGGRGGV